MNQMTKLLSLRWFNTVMALVHFLMLIMPPLSHIQVANLKLYPRCK